MMIIYLKIGRVIIYSLKKCKQNSICIDSLLSFQEEGLLIDTKILKNILILKMYTFLATLIYFYLGGTADY